jgi:hypothetical protein
MQFGPIHWTVITKREENANFHLVEQQNVFFAVKNKRQHPYEGRWAR